MARVALAGGVACHEDVGVRVAPDLDPAIDPGALPGHAGRPSCGGSRNQASTTTVESGGKPASSAQMEPMLARPSAATPLAIRVPMAQLLEQDLLDRVELQDRDAAVGAPSGPGHVDLPDAGHAVDEGRRGSCREKARKPGADDARVVAQPGRDDGTLEPRRRCSGSRPRARQPRPRPSPPPSTTRSGSSTATTVSMASRHAPAQRRSTSAATGSSSGARQERLGRRPGGQPGVLDEARSVAVPEAQHLGAAAPAAVAGRP